MMSTRFTELCGGHMVVCQTNKSTSFAGLPDTLFTFVLKIK